MANFLDYGINIPSHKTNGTIKVKCPKCGNDPKHKGRKDLSVNISEGVWKCWSASCGWTGTIKEKSQFKKSYARPEWKNNTELTEKTVKYLEGRGISQFTLRQLKLSNETVWMPQFNKEVETIAFNYFINDELVNIKYRGPKKSFRMYKDAMLCFYNIDNVINEKECYIVEGEIDALSLYEIGIHNVLSVPNGAGNGNLNLEYIDNSIDYIDHIEKFYICTDSDTPGINLRNELIRRLGAERCYLINLEKKDANEYLCAKDENENYKITPGGKDQLLEALSKKEDIKIEGVFTCEDVISSMLHTFKNGKNRGTTTYFKELDTHWTWRKGEVTIFTGYNNEGKSNFFLQLAVLKARFENWKFGGFSPENYPIQDFFDDIIHCYNGTGCDPFYKGNFMSEEDYIRGANFANDHFYLINPEDNYTFDEIILKAKYLVTRKGINCLFIDPYNQIEHRMERGEREDLYISRFMAKLKRIAVQLDIVVILIAHQVTPTFGRDEDYPQPDTYKIKGGGTFSDKSDNVIAVWRPYRRSNPQDNSVKIIVGKIKKQKLVGIPGEIDMFYSRSKNQYFEKLTDCECKGLSNIESLNKEPEPDQQLINFYEVEPNVNFDLETNESPF